MTRRELMRRGAAATAGIAFIAGAEWSSAPLASASEQRAQQSRPGTLEAAAARRAEIAKAPIQSAPLAPNMTLLSGPGGNIVVFDAGDRKIVADSFVRNAWRPLKQAIDAIGRAPVRVLIDTHWHFDHTDNNENFRFAGAQVIAHTNTKKRLSQAHDVLGMHFDPVAPTALPTDVFSSTEELHANGETIELGYFLPAHTDSDIYIRYVRSNVLHLGDVFYNGMYPFIDTTTGGNIGGMIAGANKALGLCDDRTKIVPGHGPIGDRAALTRYRDMLVMVRDRIAELKKNGRTLQETLAEKPTADLDPEWGKGFTAPDIIVTVVYDTI